MCTGCDSTPQPFSDGPKSRFSGRMAMAAAHCAPLTLSRVLHQDRKGSKGGRVWGFGLGFGILGLERFHRNCRRGNAIILAALRVTIQSF